MDNATNDVFISKFDTAKFGFFGLKAINGVKLGFFAKKKFREINNGYLIFLTVSVPNRVFNETENPKKVLNVSMGYGKEADDGYYIRQDVKLLDPMDVTFPGEYYYDINSGDFFNRDKKISADKLLEEVYSKHIKSTKLIRGFYVRTRVWFYRVFLNLLFVGLSKLFSLFIRVISGDVYEYGFSEHIDKSLNREKKSKPEKPADKPGEKVSFLGYNATPACIMFYSVFHFIVFGIFYSLERKPAFLLTIFKNGFLTLIYVMVSLIFIDKFLPVIFKKIVDGSFELSIYFSYKTIKF